ncbi:hypothetical protein [Pseudobacteroides cellulosolvens]|uniref:DUF4359 domain-containing protein n=1 Tax=Pseudobacteroides cellulosolvens ATCC 35603 = DSM 2933 TaxID=398512 RepID=A0A0L6JVK0_9FIRM|nr:hypothetical protein [Pseudobacteroides cellulosolvens]KNY29853.1 hypothetical protein Bccel_5130 [Pseudobacteroides cellulosolvens ATCC 35603 = DSM 2933]
MKKIIIAVLTCILLVAMFLTNPDKTDFNSWIVKKSLENRTSDVSMLYMFAPSSDFFDSYSNRNNFYLFSTYTVNANNNVYHYIGIFKLFLMLPI